MTTNGNESPRGNHYMENPSTASAAVNRTSDLGVRHLSCNSVNQDAITINESQLTTNTRNPSRNESDTFGYGIRTKIGAWNVRSLYGDGRYEQLEREMLRHKISILGISETRWRGRAEYSPVNGQTKMLYSGEDEREGGQRLHGVGIMLTEVARRSLISWAPISERIMTARFRSKIRNITIVQCYAPTNEATEEDKTAFYTHLNSVYNSVPKADIIIVMGDLNAQVGADNYGLERVMGKNGLGSRNENGDMLVDFCNANRLVLGGTVFKHKTCHKVTWVHPNGQTENQIDHIMIQQRWRKSMCDVRNIRNADVGSDHHIVVMSLKLRTAAVLRRSQDTARSQKFNTDAFSDPNICRNYINTLNDRASSLNEFQHSDVDEMWGEIKSVFMEAGSETVPKRTRVRDTWISQDTWDKIERRKSLKLQINAETDAQRKAELRTEYRIAHKLVYRCLRRDRRVWIDGLAENAENAARRGDIRELYQISKEIVGKKSNTNHPVMDVDGTLLVSIEDQLRRWKDHFCALLNEDSVDQSAEVPQLNEMRRSWRSIDIEPPSVTEIQASIHLLKNNKAAGLDGVPAEFLKADPATAACILHPLIQTVWENETYPSDWKDGVIVKLPKKGDLKNCNNWRGITVLSVFPKLMATLILERIKARIETTLKRHQAGFRSGRSCVDHINTLRIVLEQSAEFQSPLYLMFVDFEKAFDRVNRECIWRSLLGRGIPPKIVAIIKESYNNARCFVLHNGQLSDSFEVRQGVRQGDVLSPILFLLAIDDVLTASVGTAERQGIQWRTFERLSHLDYADDICLMANNINGLNEMCQTLRVKGESCGLRINSKKTKIMLTRRSPSQQRIILHDTPVEEVEQFNYLGSIVSANGGTDLDVKSRINKARVAFGSLSQIWKSSQVSLRTKLRFFESNVKSVLLYACETWKVSATISRKLQAFVNRCLRHILKIRWPQTISNQELWQKTRQKRVDVDIRQRKWQWIGHTLRKPNDDIAKQSFEWNPQGSRRVGRPRTTWKSTVLAEANSQRRTWPQLRHLAADREGWRRFVGALCPDRGFRN